MIIDTDVLIWYLRGNTKAKEIVENNIPFSISVVTYMEIIQGMKNKEEFKLFQKQMLRWNTKIIQIDQEISSRAMFYVQEYSLSHSMMLADGLIAATVVQNSEILLTAATVTASIAVFTDPRNCLSACVRLGSIMEPTRSRPTTRARDSTSTAVGASTGLSSVRPAASPAESARTVP